MIPHLNISKARLAFILGALAMLGPFSIDTVFPAFAIMEADLQVGKLVMQQTISVYLFGYAAMSLVHGPLSDALGRKPVIILASLIGLGLPLGMLYFAGNSMTATILCIIFGTTLSGVFPMVMATIPSEVVGPARTTTALSLTMGISEIIGGVFAPSIAGIVADAQGLAATLWILAGITGAIIVAALFLRETAPRVLARRGTAA
jgi:DHA1 family bicyclomycin/chloramphenicol resistance-like MFS transporter